MRRDDDEVGPRLTALIEHLESTLAGCMHLEQDSDGPYDVATTLRPTTPGPLPVTWIDFGDALQVEAGHVGGRWELARTPDDVEFLVELVEAVVRGDAVEVFAPGRSRMEVSLVHGETAMQTGHEGLRGIVPLPGWPTPVLDAARRLQEVTGDSDPVYSWIGPLELPDDAVEQAWELVAPWAMHTTLSSTGVQLVSLEDFMGEGTGVVRLAETQWAELRGGVAADLLVSHDSWLATRRRWAWLDPVQARLEDRSQRAGAFRSLPHERHRSLGVRRWRGRPRP